MHLLHKPKLILLWFRPIVWIFLTLLDIEIPLFADAHESQKVAKL